MRGLLIPGAALLLGAAAPPSSAPRPAAPRPAAHWHLEPDRALPPPPDAAETGRPVAPPMIAAAPWPAPRLFGQVASEVREGLIDRPAATATPFSVELWLSDHVNRPVGALLAGVDEGGQAAWTLGYFSAAGNDKFERGAALRFGPVELPDAGRPPWRRYLNHIVGTFDGRSWRLYHNGVLAAEAAGPPAPFRSVHLAGYLAAEPHMRLPDLVRDASFHQKALSAVEVAAAFTGRQSEIVAATRGGEPALRFTAGPHLTPPGNREQALLWETDHRAAGTIEWGETAALGQRTTFSAPDRLHRAVLSGLKPDTAYFYRVTARDDAGALLDSGMLSFRTMPAAGAPLVFAATADTQERPFVAFRLARNIWEQRPHFLLLAGDLVGGEEDERRWHWTDEYFTGIGTVAARIPVLAARGNGDVDVVDPAGDVRRFTNFDRYHNQPDKGLGYFVRRIGDADFFVLDGNLALGERLSPGFRSRQRAWLEAALKASNARWKILVHHQPAYSSDDDDYGDAHAGATTGGDPDIRKDFVDLYDRLGVDLVISGHIHSYERSWPLTAGAPGCGGVTYLQLGGGGGDRERPAPTSQPITAALLAEHHHALFRLWGGELELQVYDAEGRLRDQAHLIPRSEARRRCPATSRKRH